MYMCLDFVLGRLRWGGPDIVLCKPMCSDPSIVVDRLLYVCLGGVLDKLNEEPSL
jgi:hypothetical protein